MSILDSILGQVSENATVRNLAAKVGLTPEEIETAVTALGQAHTDPGDTIDVAAQNTGLPGDKLKEIVSHIGGEGSLGRFASILEGDGAKSILGGLSKIL